MDFFCLFFCLVNFLTLIAKASGQHLIMEFFLSLKVMLGFCW
ncbi:hypothetical protein wTpre_144 [Wolbachia endosymbiont of Trichogramma pretiosum]|nr:hypothetical protein wTpre_144 [Wolbachia endosymbiont of Trichogramma pretiosum]